MQLEIILDVVKLKIIVEVKVILDEAKSFARGFGVHFFHEMASEVTVFASFDFNFWAKAHQAQQAHQTQKNRAEEHH
ncbi:hypothetical protein Csa_020312 [Cucumis sativus]|uniref:Uncharacterized protein n=1 Tax=Cucumis sativus TaxID=3659 RepID=A0A0A0K1K7_CUCSA|nr:hypothetical protein Csa_020312 [Cucumis sativus]